MRLPPTQDLTIAAAAALAALFALYHSGERRSRTRKVQRTDERVLILGASSGVGRALAHMYAQRGARVCVVGRRKKEIEEVELECQTIQKIKEPEEDRKAFSVCVDFADPEQMIMLRDVLQAEWQGVDTVIITAGVISLQPLLSVANLKHDSDHVELEGVKRVVEVAQAALHSNFVGPLVTATTFIPLLLSTSSSPSILLMSSLASVIPAPTRSLYAATKSSALLLYESLAIEHPSITFSLVMPSTIKGDFRLSAVDGGSVRDTSSGQSQKGLDKSYVARKCIGAIDYRKKHVFIPGFHGISHLLYWLFPSFVEARAREKYQFIPKPSSF